MSTKKDNFNRAVLTEIWAERVMSTIDFFKSILDDFFTKAHCNDSLKNENDFQEKVAKYLVEKGFYVLREVYISEDDLSAIHEKLNQAYIEIDIVAFKDDYFFPIELKFQNKNYQSDHIDVDDWERDKVKMQIMYETYNDVAVARCRLLSNDEDLRGNLEKDYECQPVVNGENEEESFWYIWHWWVNQPRNPKESFAPLWNKTVNTRVPNRGKKGDTLFTIAAIKEKEAIHNFGQRLTKR